jgi:putative flippase GtrA
MSRPDGEPTFRSIAALTQGVPAVVLVSNRNAAPKRLLVWLVRDLGLLAKGLRFGLIGGISGAVFALATVILISFAGLEDKSASVLAYIASMPVNFIGQRYFTFRSQGRLVTDGFRFCMLHLANMAVTAGAMGAAVSALGLHYGFGIVGAILLVPLSSFSLMNLWVFATKPRAGSL